MGETCWCCVGWEIEKVSLVTSREVVVVVVRWMGDERGELRKESEVEEESGDLCGGVWLVLVLGFLQLLHFTFLEREKEGIVCARGC